MIRRDALPMCVVKILNKDRESLLGTTVKALCKNRNVRQLL